MPNTIAENLQRLVDARSDIASAITAKGGTVNTGDGFEEFPGDIATIPKGVTTFTITGINGSYGNGFFDGNTLILCGIGISTSSMTFVFPAPLSDYGFNPSSPINGDYICGGASGIRHASLSGSSTSITVNIQGANVTNGFYGTWTLST